MCPKNWPGCGVSPDGLFHRRRGADNSGPTVLNANVVAVQNATKVSYMGQTTAARNHSPPQVDLET